MNTPYAVTIDIQAMTHHTSPRTATFEMVFTHWAGDALTLADVIREAILEQAESLPKPASTPPPPPPPPPNEPVGAWTR